MKLGVDSNARNGKDIAFWPPFVSSLWGFLKMKGVSLIDSIGFFLSALAELINLAENYAKEEWAIVYLKILLTPCTSSFSIKRMSACSLARSAAYDLSMSSCS